MQTAKVAIVGLGTVGSGVAKILDNHADRIARRAGRRVELARVVVRDLKKTRGHVLPAGMISTDLADITNDKSILAVAHLVGGLEPARSIMLQLLESGKDVITANKALLAEHGPELFDRARELGRSIAFEASVGGGIPIIATINQCLSANQILSVAGILNGTSNYILTQMEERGAAYAEAVAEAQRLGYAEEDPTMDIDGADAAQKLAILAHLAFGSRTDWQDIPRQGIDQLQLSDIQNARELGYRIKLLANAELLDDGIEMHVSPTLVKLGAPLAEVRGAYNAIRLMGDAVGRVFLHGLGAGQMPTASAVVADLIDTVVGRSAITFGALNLWNRSDAAPPLRSPEATVGRFYLRFNVDDRPGVMAEITGVLGAHGISIASVIQHEAAAEDVKVVPLIIMTHSAREHAVSQACEEINNLSCTRARSVRMRVRD